MVKKIIKHSNKNKLVPKPDLSLGHSNGDSDEGLDMVGFKYTTIGERAVLEIGRKMLLWSKTTSELKITPFFHEQGISMRTANRWCHRYPLFGEWFEEAMTMIGDRREKLALYRDIDSSIVMKTMHLYDPGYKKGLAWLESIKHHEADNRQQMVIIDRFPSSDLVPPLKD